jgi:hypothetical protein
MALLIPEVATHSVNVQVKVAVDFDGATKFHADTQAGATEICLPKFWQRPNCAELFLEASASFE